MTKEQVIKMRTVLKAGKNWPLIVYIDNAFRNINEANALQFTKWDDENGILYHYSISDPIKDHSPSNLDGGVSLFATDYEMIQSMEVANIRLDDLGASIDSLNNISDEWKQRIIERFKLALNPNKAFISREEINKAMGVIDNHKAINDSDDYYNNRFTESFAETRAAANRNEYVENLAKAK